MHFFHRKLPLFIVSILAILAACDELPCAYTNGVQVYAGFYTYDGITLGDTSLKPLILILDNDNGTSYSDTFLFGAQNISFPLSMQADSSRIILAYSDTTADTIVFYYTKNLYLESHECGFTNFFEITDITNTTHELDSIRIPKELIDYDEQENLKIFY